MEELFTLLACGHESFKHKTRYGKHKDEQKAEKYSCQN